MSHPRLISLSTPDGEEVPLGVPTQGNGSASRVRKRMILVSGNAHCWCPTTGLNGSNLFLGLGLDLC